MTYFADLTPFAYNGQNENTDRPTLNAGWLDVSQLHPMGETSPEFQDRLFDFCLPEYMVHLCRGYHECQFCQNPSYMITVERGYKTADLGNGEIRVIGTSAIYAAPTLIYHYVVTHHYRPPKEFIEAVLTSPSPASEEYAALRSGLDIF